LRSQVGHRTRELEAALRDVQSQERRLKESEEQFRKIFEIAPFAIAITRFPDGQYLQVNPALEKLTGYSAAELPGKSLVEILPPEANAAVPALHERLWRDGRVDGQMIAERSKDGALRHYLYSSALFLERGEQKVLTILVDMTETKRLEEELRQSQKMDVVGQLAGGISHDFNNMLTGIMGNTELLALKLPRGSPLLEFTSATLEASKRAADLTRKLLSFSRKGKLATAPLDIHVPLKATIGLLEASIDRRIRIISDFQAVGICIQGDNTLLQNVFLNLGVNSRDAMPEGGTLTFATSVVTLDEGACRNRFLPMAPGEYVEVKVCDTGVGIPRENLEKIFEPFFTTKEIGKGTGLGLATVYGAVREHGGGLSVTSEIGEGTTFRVFLPVHRLGPAGGEVRAEEPRMGSGRILVIEDESLIRLLVNTMLQRLGYEVVLAEDGQEGIEIFERELGRFDLVLSDVIMPRLNGRQVLVHLKERYPAVKVVFGSGFHDQETRDELMKLGALGFLQKPYDLAELSQIISQGLKARPPGHPRAKR
jgi:PAS domain S-box-containing protein